MPPISLVNRSRPFEALVEAYNAGGVATASSASAALALAQAPTNSWSTSTKLDEVSTLTTIEASPVDKPNLNLPEALSLRTFTLGGAGGPSFQIAENFGATPVQITAYGEEILSSNATPGSYKRELTGAGSIGGIPIVAPAGRTLSSDNKAVVNYGGQQIADWTGSLVNKETKQGRERKKRKSFW